MTVIHLSTPATINLGNRDTLAVELVPFMEREIIARRLKPGERLVELELCARFGVSRSPMREALRLLEQSLLVTRKPRYGVRVAPMTLENLDHIYACRAPLEALAAASIARISRRDKVVEVLDGCVQQMQSAAEAGDVEACFFANVNLTDVLHEQCQNPVLRTLLAQIDKAALRYRHWAFCERPTIISLSIRANQDMVEAIRSGRPKRAESITRELVLETWSRLRRDFGNRSDAQQIAIAGAA